LLPIFILEPDINKKKKSKKGERENTKKFEKVERKQKKIYISEKSILERQENHRRLVDES
jgi:hypothetical protein